MRKVLISIFTLIFIISMSVITVNAATSGSITLEPSSTTIKAGEEFTVIISAKDSNGYNGIQYGNITITDSNDSTTSNIELKDSNPLENNSKDIGAGEEEGQTLYHYTLTDNNTSNLQVCKLTFKVNSNTTAGTYKVNISNIKVYSRADSDDTTDVGTRSVQVAVTTDGTPAVDPIDDGDTDAGDGDTTGTKTPSKNTGTKNGSGSGSGKLASTDSGDEEEDDKELPQTGVEVVSIVAIAGLSACAIVSYISYKKYKNI